MISKSGSQPQISRFLYIGPTVKCRSKLSFSSKKKKKKTLQISQLNQVFGLQKWKMTILTYTSIFQTIPVGRTVQICD